MTPGSCSTGIHILLEECEAVFEVTIVNLMKGDQYQPEYLEINPRATIPALQRDDGSALTDFQSIAWWLAHQYPRAGLLPAAIEDQLKIFEVMNYAVATVHMQGFARLFTTERFTPQESDYPWVRQQGMEIINDGFRILDSLISEAGFITDHFSIADAALFYIEFWAIKSDIELPANCLRHYQKLLKRSTVRQVLAEEGYRI